MSDELRNLKGKELILIQKKEYIEKALQKIQKEIHKKEQE